MQDRKANDLPATAADGSPVKKPYQRPVLRRFGALHLVTQGASGPAADMGTMKMSDRSSKESIVRIDTHPLGIGLYLFDYKPEHRERYGYGRQFGVMADEVEVVMPGAVSVHPSGFKMVNYDMLGVRHSIR